MIAGLFEVPASLLAALYALTHDYAASIALIAVIVMALVTPLTLKSTKGMLEMQRLAPEMRRLQNEHRGDRQKLNEEMMKLYQEHKVNPMASCLPLVAQTPVFIIMYRILRGLSYRPVGGDKLVAQAVLEAGGRGPNADPGILPRYLSHSSKLYESLVGQQEMRSLGLDLSRSTAEMLGSNFGRGLIYASLVVLLGALYFVQQRMVASRAAVNPTMSASQQKLMQYLPVMFAVFQVFFLLGLVIYYIVQTILRIGQQHYITKRFYHGDESLGRQAQAASQKARDLAKADGDTGGGGLFAQAKRDLAQARDGAPQASGGKPAKSSPASKPTSKSSSSSSTKRTTEPKSRPTPSAKQATGRPGQRPSSGKKRRRG